MPIKERETQVSLSKAVCTVTLFRGLAASDPLGDVAVLNYGRNSFVMTRAQVLETCALRGWPVPAKGTVVKGRNPAWVASTESNDNADTVKGDTEFEGIGPSAASFDDAPESWSEGQTVRRTSKGIFVVGSVDPIACPKGVPVFAHISHDLFGIDADIALVPQRKEHLVKSDGVLTGEVRWVSYSQSAPVEHVADDRPEDGTRYVFTVRATPRKIGAYDGFMLRAGLS